MKENWFLSGQTNINWSIVNIIMCMVWNVNKVSLTRSSLREKLFVVFWWYLLFEAKKKMFVWSLLVNGLVVKIFRSDKNQTQQVHFATHLRIIGWAHFKSQMIRNVELNSALNGKKPNIYWNFSNGTALKGAYGLMEEILDKCWF